MIAYLAIFHKLAEALNQANYSSLYIKIIKINQSIEFDY